MGNINRRFAKIVLIKSNTIFDTALEYAVPEHLQEGIKLGQLVKVPFKRAVTDGIVIELTTDCSVVDQKLKFVSSILHDEPLLTSVALKVIQNVARYYATPIGKAIKYALPQGIAATFRSGSESVASNVNDLRQDTNTATRSALKLQSYQLTPGITGESLDILEGHMEIARLLKNLHQKNRGALMLFPNEKTVTMIENALIEQGLRKWSAESGGDFVNSSTKNSKERRLQYFALQSGKVKIVIGTRGIALWQVKDPCFFGIYADDAFEYRDGRYPHINARDTLLISAIEHAKVSDDVTFSLFGYSPSAFWAYLTKTRGMKTFSQNVTQINRALPLCTAHNMETIDDLAPFEHMRIPASVQSKISNAVKNSPVLVIVPGGHFELDYRKDVERTAFELENSHPAATIIVHEQEKYMAHIKEGVGKIVVTDSNQLPFIEGGYGLTVLLDAQYLASATHINSSFEVLQKLVSACLCTKAQKNGGEMIVVGNAESSALNAFMYWNFTDFALREIEDRDIIGLPPYTRFAKIITKKQVMEYILELIRQNANITLIDSYPITETTELGYELETDNLCILVSAPFDNFYALPSAVEHIKSAIKYKFPRTDVSVEFDVKT
ncbi:MAG: hypothetical protein LBL41_02110 [Bifidobacteriaceae bacterium]|jgi:primosomal protein N' (replication factor Y)|nr:hypothetical protein [Bifidobacteriaceae bacterium]